MSQRRTALETRELIFEACGRILQREGLTNLTLSAVSVEAGLSKGGLLYHFPTKESLVKGLFEYHNDKFDTRMKVIAKEEKEETGDWLRAYVRASMEQIIDPDSINLYASLYAAGEEFVSAHQMLQRKFADWQQQIEASLPDPTWATLLRFAVDGLWFAEMHKYAPPEQDQRQKIVELIMSLSRKPLRNDGSNE
ncbi:MAG: TetR/AcrR family transcriptional regulator [Chloroflexi bacterium]|nr:MAG: TetR/AcrR family transcriptional regulator [Chloroflexota bacterium]